MVMALPEWPPSPDLKQHDLEELVDFQLIQPTPLYEFVAGFVGTPGLIQGCKRQGDRVQLVICLEMYR